MYVSIAFRFEFKDHVLCADRILLKVFLSNVNITLILQHWVGHQQGYLSRVYKNRKVV